MRSLKPIIKQNSSSPPVHQHPPSPGNSTLFFAKNIVIMIAIMFLVCGVLHYLVRFIMNKIRLSSNFYNNQSTRFQESGDGDGDAAVYQRQLQQLFKLHDSGLDQSSIDALPVFFYKELMGYKEHHHCAVCLCEFTEHDKLRLLPVCSHAFHTHCIDTWLLSNSTCPLCRGSLFTPGFSFINPAFDFDFDHNHDLSREDDEVSYSSNNDDGVSGNINQSGTGRVYPVRLGKFRAVNGEDKQEVGQSSNCNGNLDERRCYSMGSYEYVVANSDLQVVFCSDDKGKIGNSNIRIQKDSSFDEGRNGKEISIESKRESFSVSKIWLWSKKDDHKFQDCSTPHTVISSLNVSSQL